MDYSSAVPYIDKVRAPDLDQAIDKVVMVVRQRKQRLAELDEQLSVVVASAVTEALAKGASLRELAQHLDVSPETVRKMKRGVSIFT